MLGRAIPELEELCLGFFGVLWRDGNVFGIQLYNCHLSVLPESLGVLESLIVLRLDGNHIAVLPESF